ncbi:MAG: GtrA family protein [Syntrophobacteraceae bacterium]
MTECVELPSSQYRSKPGAFVRFLLSGAFNTAATYALYLVLLRFVPYRISYTAAYISGIILAYRLNRTFVFSSNRGIGTALLFPLVYVVQYLVGLAVVSVWVELLGWRTSLAPMAAIALSIPITFVLSRWVFTGERFSLKQ